jgi:Entner-Doudoroff aldolase
MASQLGSDDFFVRKLARVPVLAVLRGGDPARIARVAEDCWTAGIDLVEVSLSHDRDLVGLRLVCQAAAQCGRVAGAGTVCTAEQVRAAADAGAGFAVAPGLDVAAVEAARSLGLPFLPGVATASEVQAALSLGCRTVKAFPASVLGPDWLRSMSRPFPTVRFIAVGGVTLSNAREFLAAGAIGLGIGSALDPKELRSLLGSIAAHAGAGIRSSS